METSSKLVWLRRIQLSLICLLVIVYMSYLAYTIWISSQMSFNTVNAVVVNRIWNHSEAIFIVSCGMCSGLAMLFMSVIYLHFPKLRRFTHGKILTCYLISTAIIYPSNALIELIDNLELHPRTPLQTALAIHVPKVSALISCTWLALIGCHTWYTFSRPLKPQGPKSQKSKDFHFYFFVGCGFPLFVFVQQGCLLYFDREVSLVYTVSWRFIIALNLVFFTSTLFNLRFHFSKCDGLAVRRHGGTIEGLTQYIKLAALTGIHWVVLLVAIISKNRTLVIVGCSLIFLQGVFKFFILVCNKRVLSMLSQMWGRRFESNVGSDQPQTSLRSSRK